LPQPSKTTTVCSALITLVDSSSERTTARGTARTRQQCADAVSRHAKVLREAPATEAMRRVVSLSVIQRRLAVRCTPRGCALLCTNQMMCSRSPSDGCSDAMLMKWDFSPKQLSAYTCVRASVRMAHARYCVRVRGTALRSSSAGATSSDIKCKSFDRAHARVLRSAPTDMHVPSGLCGLVSRSAFGCRPRFLRRSRLLLAAVCLHLSARAEQSRAEPEQSQSRARAEPEQSQSRAEPSRAEQERRPNGVARSEDGLQERTETGQMQRPKRRCSSRTLVRACAPALPAREATTADTAGRWTLGAACSANAARWALHACLNVRNYKHVVLKRGIVWRGDKDRVAGLCQRAAQRCRCNFYRLVGFSQP
jgi:hypothetical protein